MYRIWQERGYCGLKIKPTEPLGSGARQIADIRGRYPYRLPAFLRAIPSNGNTDSSRNKPEGRLRRPESERRTRMFRSRRRIPSLAARTNNHSDLECRNPGESYDLRIFAD